MPMRRCRNRTTRVNQSSLIAAVGETRSGRAWSMYIRREPRRFGDEVTTRPQTATAEAMERPRVGMVRKRMVKTRESSGEL